MVYFVGLKDLYALLDKKIFEHRLIAKQLFQWLIIKSKQKQRIVKVSTPSHSFQTLGISKQAFSKRLTPEDRVTAEKKEKLAVRVCG